MAALYLLSYIRMVARQAHGQYRGCLAANC
jgi:hypothetical protein